MDKLKRFSFLIATVFILGALAVKMAKPEWQLYSNIAIGIGATFFLLSLWFERSELKHFFSARSTKYGLNTFVMIILVLGIVVLVNWIVARHPLKYDTTKNKEFSLSSLTVNALQKLKQPVKITAFFIEAEDEASRTKMQDLLENYREQSKMLETRLVDPYKNPRLAQQSGITANATTVIESGDQKTTISTANEEDLTNAILRVTASRQMTVYFLQGHGEPEISNMENAGLSGVVDQIKKTNYAVQELKDLAATGKIPEDCDVLVIPAPQVNLLDHEVKAILDYLQKGGRVLLCYDPQADASVTKIFEPFHIKPDPGVVVDDRYFFPLADIAVPLIVPQTGTPVTREFNYQMFFPVTKSFSYEQPEGSNVTLTPFVQSSQFSWAETDEKTAAFDEGKDKKGPLNVGILVSKPAGQEEPAEGQKPEETAGKEMRMVVFGDYTFAQNAFVGIPGNKQIFMNAVAWLTEQENLIHLPPRPKGGEVMTLSSTQLRYIGLGLIIVLPLAVLSTGIAVWVRRKKL